jgi:hypothetical protein
MSQVVIEKTKGSMPSIVIDGVSITVATEDSEEHMSSEAQTKV